MKNPVHILIFSAALVTASACQKENEDPITASLDICGIDGMRLEAEVDGSETCFSASLFGNEVEGELSLGGVNPTFGSMALLLNDLTVGTHAASDSLNHIVLIAGGVAYQSSAANPGTIMITSHDQAANRIKGSFSSQVMAADGSPSRAVSGTFDVTYLEL